MRISGKLCLVFLWAASFGASASTLQSDDHPTPYAERADVQAYIQELVAEHAFSRSWLEAAFAQARQRDDIIERISAPAEKVWTWGRYRKHLVDDARIAQGVEFWAAHEATIRRASQTFGVAQEMIVAILGIETLYGRIKGNYRVIDALTTLGFDYPPRAKFFRKELTEFLLLVREEGKDPLAVMGSYAGAMGYGQFISSSYRYYAVDFDGDGVRDIWQDPVDAVGSIANYFSKHRWSGQYPAAVPVVVSDHQMADAEFVDGSLNLSRTVGELRAKGVQVEGLDASLKAALYKFEGDQGTEYWVALHDFYVITRYNRSTLYALAAFQLAQAIKAERLTSQNS